MKTDIVVATINVLPAHELIISAACTYYQTTRDELFAVSKLWERARRKAIVFYLLEKECQLVSRDVARICAATRQNVDQLVNKAESEVSLYLQSSCDYRNIKGIYSNLLSKQEEWLNQHLPRSNTKP